MTTDESVTTWIGQLKIGQEVAAQRLWERYFSRLVELARSKLRGSSKRIADEEDVVLAAFNSFCRGVADQRYPRLDNRDDLWQLLLMLTARKAVDQRRYEQRRKRGGPASEERLRQAEDRSQADLEEIIGREPDPQFAALVAEQFQLLLTRLADEDLRVVALARLQGHTNVEIAEQLDCSLRSVERKLMVIRGLWQEALPE